MSDILSKNISRFRESEYILICWWFFVLMICFLLSSSNHCLAETKYILNVPFTVQEITPVGPNSVKVRIFGKSKIVSKDLLDEHILYVYFGKEGNSRVEPELIKSFVKASLGAKDTEHALQAFRAFMRNDAVDQEQVYKLIEELSKRKLDAEFFQTVLSFSKDIQEHPKAVAALVFYTGLNNLEWLRANAIRYVYLYSDELRSMIDRKYYQSLNDREFARAGRIVKLEGGLFGFDDAGYEKRRVLGEKIRLGLQGIARGDVDGIYPLIDLSKKDAKLGQVLPDLITKSIHRQADKDVTMGEYAKALKILSLIDMNWRTPKTHRLVKTCLEQLNINNKSANLDAGMKHFLQSLCNKDAGIRNVYINYLDKNIALDLEAGHSDKAQSLFRELISVRPDPDAANDRIRVEQALLLTRLNLKQVARSKLKELQTGLTLGERIRIFFSGLYFNPLLIALILFLCAAVATLAHLKLKSQAVAVKRLPEEAAEEDGERPIFSKVSSSGMNPRYGEYLECLDQLGLDHAASLKKIKATYRVVVKKLHPDLHANQSQADKEKFLGLSRTYERLLELRKELGYPD